MSGYKSLITVLLKQRYKRAQGKSGNNQLAAYIILAVSLGMLIAAVCFGLWFVAPAFSEAGNPADLPHFVLSIICLIIIMLGMVSMISYVYMSNDAEFLSALPIKPSTVFAAKISVVLIEEFIFAAFAAIAPLIVCGLALKAGVIYYCLIPLMLIMVPLLPLFIISLLAIPVMYLVSFFKSRGFFTTVALVLVFGAFYGGYYLLTQNIDKLTQGQAANALTGVAQPFVYMFYPLYQICRAATGMTYTAFGDYSTLISLVIGVGSTAAIIAVAIFISSLFYYRGMAAQLENRKAKAAAGGSFAASPAVSALIKKEFKEMTRTPAIGFQCFMPIVLTPIIIFGTSGSFSGIPQEEMLPQLAAIMKTLMGIMIIGCLSGVNMSAATAISREGSNFFYLKILPVDYRKLIEAKHRMYFYFTLAAIFPAGLVVLALGADILMLLSSLMFLLPFGYASVCFLMNADINSPKLAWSTPTEAMKSNKVATVNILIGVGLGTVITIIPLVLAAFILQYIWILYTYWAAAGIVMTALAVMFHLRLYKNIEQRLETIE